LRVDGANTASLLLDDRLVPVDKKGNMMLRFRGPVRTFAHLSAAQILSGRFRPDTFLGKIAIVGATALGARETVTTPVDRLFTGVEVQATAVDNLLGGDVVFRPDSAPALEAIVTFGSGVALTFLITRSGPFWGWLAAAIWATSMWMGAAWMFSARRAFLSPVVPTLGGFAELGALAVAFVVFERRRHAVVVSKLAESRRLLVQSLLSLTEIRDTATGLHSRRTQQYTRLLAQRLATHERFRGFLTPARIELLASLAPLHDIGKVGVPDRLLNKEGTLTRDEFDEMRKHPGYGRAVIAKAEEHVGIRDDDVLEMAKEIVYTHHERWDGCGYPSGLSGDHIPIPGRVVTLVDVYDALTTVRTYRQPLSHDAAAAVIIGGRGSHFDPAVVDAFLDVATAFRSISSSAAAARVT